MGKKYRRNRLQLTKKANWSGVEFVSRAVGCKHDLYVFEGYRYCTYGEFMVAKLLTTMGVSFTPDVSFRIENDGTIKNKTRFFVPDFVFNGDEYFWTELDGAVTVIHGIECKAGIRKPEKIRLLYEQRGINILILSEAEIDYYAQRSRLPLCLSQRYK
jgi:hypothetical protein